MRAYFLKVWHGILESYWFIPALMALGAFALFFLSNWVDRRTGTEWVDKAAWLYANRPSGARALLSTIAGSMITVAGVTFSITVATVVQAASRHGPRLLTNFLHDRGSQITLGTFVATFLYCLLVLRTVHGSDGTGTPEVFVPHVSILCGVLLAIASLGVLIYFIHHIPESVHVSNMVARIGQLLYQRTSQIFPAGVGREPPDPGYRRTAPEVLAHMFRNAAAVSARTSGYVQQLDGKGLIDLARRHDLVIWVRTVPGSFVSPETSLALVAGEPAPPEAVLAEVRQRFAFGAKRTPVQDVRFLADLLVEVAVRALSPGVNDPFTAINCISWLGGALGRMARQAEASPDRFDEDGNLRLVAHGHAFEQLADSVFDQLRHYVESDPNAALHLFETLGTISASARTARQREVLRQQADALYRGCQGKIAEERDRERIARCHQAVLGAIAAGSA